MASITHRRRPSADARSADVIARSFSELADDLGELEYLAADASGRLRERARTLLQRRRHLEGDSLDVIEQHVRTLLSAYDGVRRDVRGLRLDAERGPRSAKLLEGLSAARRGLADRLRTMAGIAAATITASEWQSPSFDHSIRPNAGVATGLVHPHVDDYRRDRHPDAAAFEARYLAEYVDRVEGLDLRALLTSCGMSAFVTILGSLRETGGLAGPVVVGASVYHECRDLLVAAVPPRTFVEVSEHPPDALPAAIRRHRPTAVFLDSIGNAPGTLAPALAGVVRALEAVGGRAYLVLDNTALSCTFQPFGLLEPGSKVRMIEFESLTKYAQLGLDRVTGGAIVAEREVADRLDVHREHLGANIPDASVHAIPGPNRSLLERRLMRLGRNAFVLAEGVRAAAERTGGDVVTGADYPGLPDHPSHRHAGAARFRGGWLSVRFAEAHDLPEVHHRLLDLVIDEARRRDAQIVAGASFGLDTTRVYATARTSAAGRPFVRVSAGIEHLADVERIAASLGAAVVRLVEERRGIDAARPAPAPERHRLDARSAPARSPATPLAASSGASTPAASGGRARGAQSRRPLPH